MPIKPFLALTWAEMENCEEFPEKTAWLGCHFSPSGKGLSNLPPSLSPGSLLIIDDANPIQGHDPHLVSQQTAEIVKEMNCFGVLLDFQRQNQEGAQEMAQAIINALPCPVAVSALYAMDLDCPVFLPPVPHNVPLEETLWNGRECWLELALDGEVVTVTEQGASISTLDNVPEAGFSEESLHCHYTLELSHHQAKWKLWRTREDLERQLQAASRLGVTQAVGLWQEWNK